MTDQTPLRALFDEEYYLSQFRDRAEVGGDPFEHYMSIGWREGRKPHRLLDIAKYIPQYFEIALETTNPLQHYVSNVLPTLASEFDADFYVQSLGEEAEPGVDPLWHYCLHGWREGYDPRPDFSAGAYLDLHPDVFVDRQSSEHLVLIFFVMFEMTKGRDSFWYPYFQITEKTDMIG